MITNKNLLKFRQPLNIEYIQKNILKLNKKQTLNILDKYIKADILEKDKGYYVLKRNN
jgi:uncharacterized membrane-anchored protein YjiN (DUF445 family)